MSVEKPKRLNHNIANFVAGLGALSLSSGILLMPQIDTDAKGEIIPLLLTLAFGFFGWKASDLLIKTIKDKKLSAKREAVVIWCLPIFYIVVLSILSDITFLTRSHSETSLPSSQVISEEQSPEIDITVSSQPAQGVTQKEMNSVFLKNYEMHTVERIKHHIEEAKKSGLKTISPEQITAVTSYVEMDEKKLAVIRMNSPVDTSVFVLGIMNDELKRVGCMHGSQNSIPITYGKCGDKIKEVFNLP